MTLGTWLFTKMRGERVGTDAEGNLYYQDKRLIAGRRRKRWVMYNGVVEASRVPPEWDGWLHYTTDVVPPAGGAPRKTWQKDHEPNPTGTDHAYKAALAAYAQKQAELKQVQTPPQADDFSKAKRGAVLRTPPGKTRITIYLDDVVIERFKTLSEKTGVNPSPILGLAFSPDGRTIASGSGDGSEDAAESPPDPQQPA